MQTRKLTRVLAIGLWVVMLMSVVPMNAFAAFRYDETATSDDYYKLISERNWQLAPGIEETEVVINNEQGSRRQVVHSVKIDMNNPYTKVIPGYKVNDEGTMIPKQGQLGTESTSSQALNAEKAGYGNVVAATNAMLSWYNNAYYAQHPEFIGQPLGWNILEGQYYENSQGPLGDMKTDYAALIINYDNHPETGEPRPADMPKVQMRKIGDPLTGWEENAFSVWVFLVKPDPNDPTKGKSVYTSTGHSGGDSRTFVGITANGEIILSVSDGGQAPFSSGFSMEEMADYMIKMGCIYAANCDGGGSTTFCSQRPGEDLKVNCSLSDGGERPTTNTFLVISTAPSDGEFAQATVSSDYNYYTPGSTVEFSVLGTDAVGTKTEIPEDVQWQIKEEGMGTIENGVFTSNGTEGLVTAQMVYKGKVVGECSINIATPDEISFSQPIVTIPFGKEVTIPVKATIGNGLFEIGLGANDVTFVTDNDEIGAFNGLQFTAVSEENAPANLVANVTATLKMGTNPTATVQIKLGKASQVLFDFEGGQSDIDVWNVINNRNGKAWDYEMNLSLADRTNGQVHDGNYSMRLHTNGLSSKDSHSQQYAFIRLGVDGDAIKLNNARALGFWLYVPEDNIQCWVKGYYMFDSNGDGTPDTLADVNMMDSENVYRNVDESGWHYLQMYMDDYEQVDLRYSNKFALNDGSGQSGEFFLTIVFHKAINNKLWQENGSINGPYTYYLDNITVDYSEAVDDREEPIFGKLYLDETTPLVKRDVVTTTSNVLNLSAEVADATVRTEATGVEHSLYNISGLDLNTAKVFVDGIEVPSAYTNGKLVANNVTVANGYHRIKFEVCDKAGNKAVMIRLVNVAGNLDASTLKLVPADPTLDRIPLGSIYWMNLVANKLETIQSVDTVIDLNNVSHWQLDNMDLAEGFSATYTIDPETNTATITFTRTGENDTTGEAILAKIPVRAVDYEADIHIPGQTPASYWQSFYFWPQDIKLDVDLGKITFVDGYTSSALNAFSNEEFHVDTETYLDYSNIDKTYLAEHQTVHVHNAQPIADKDPSCTENGYKNRTFCEGCNSVIDWGETIPATGHIYHVEGNHLVCYCGKVYTGSGLKEVNGKNYFLIAGVLISGWQNIDNEWYLFDEKTYAGVNGTQYSDAAVPFTFENGKVLHGTWMKVKGQMRYFYGPTYYKKASPTPCDAELFEIDGQKYLFDKKGFMCTGFKTYFEPTSKATLIYDCGEDGKAELLTGIFSDGRYYKDGKRASALYTIVEYNGNYYFYTDGNVLAKNQTLYLREKFTAPVGLKEGYYTFDAEGKMVFKDGIINDHLYINDEMIKCYQLYNYEGDYYFISDSHKIAKNTRVYLSKKYLEGKTFEDGTPIPEGYYEFNAEGKMQIKNGVIGKLLYKNNTFLKCYQLVEYDGEYYFINDGHKLAMNTRLYLTNRFVSGHTFADGEPIPAGYYEFDETGKMQIKEGVIGNAMYHNNAMVNCYQLYEYNGDFYFINDGNRVTKNAKVYLTEKYVSGKTYADGTAILPGQYEFDADGKMIGKNGVYGDVFYRNGIMLKAYQLVEYEGNFYFVSDGNKVAKNTKVYLTSKLVAGKTFADGSMIEVGYYQFDAEGKMIH